MALALRRRDPSIEILGTDPDPEQRELARRSGAFVELTDDLGALAAAVDLLVLAAPVAAIMEGVGELKRLPAGRLRIVTDVGSSKYEICRCARDLPSHLLFVGGHPLAGAEVAGFASADPLLFEGAVWVLSPVGAAAGAGLAAVRDLVARLGAEPLQIEAEAHDRIVACTSHVPQLLAVALANTLAELELEYPEAYALAGGGFRDLTRIAASPHSIWSSILESNREAIDLALRALAKHVAGALSPDLGEGAFTRAAEVRSSLAPRHRGAMTPTFDVMVVMTHATGVLAAATGVLADAGLDLLDVELVRVKERVWGTFRFAFGSETDRERAIEALGGAGYEARPRG